MRISDWSSDVCSSDLKDYSELNDDQLTDDYHYTIFPNVSMNVHADDVMMFRQRPHPTNPDKMFYDVWLFELVPDGEEWPERPKHKRFKHGDKSIRSEEHTSELQSLMRNSYAVFFLKKKKKKK